MPSGVAAACPSWESQVQVSAPTTAVTIRRDKSTPEVTAWAQAQRPGEAQGLATIAFRHETLIIEKPTDKNCYRPGVLVRVMPDPSTIYIAKEVEVGSCFDDQLLEHEFKHIYAGHRALSQNVPRIKREIVRLFNAQDIAMTNEAEATQLASKGFFNSLPKVIEDTDFENNKIDSQAEALWIHRNCGYTTEKTQTQILHAPPIIKAPMGYQSLSELPRKP